MEIKPVTDIDVGDWLTLRQLLFPDTDDVRHEEQAAVILGNRFRNMVLLYRGDQGEPVGFVEVSLRQQADGCHSSPVAYLEGLFVVAGRRRQGLATQLVCAGEEWARVRGCREFASDSEIGNEVAHLTHQQLGFEVTQRAVLYRKSLAPARDDSVDRVGSSGPDKDELAVDALPMLPATESGVSGCTVFHFLVGLVGVVSLVLADISSPDLMAGAIYPTLGAFAVVYVGVVLTLRRYRSRTDERDRGEELFRADDEQE